MENRELVLLNAFPNEAELGLNVFSVRVVFRVLGQGLGTHVVNVQRN
jgi:hypothetical protein